MATEFTVRAEIGRSLRDGERDRAEGVVGCSLKISTANVGEAFELLSREFGARRGAADGEVDPTRAAGVSDFFEDDFGHRSFLQRASEDKRVVAARKDGEPPKGGGAG